MDTKDFALSVKQIDESGTFEGYASVSGNVDSYGDVVAPGAFAESLAKHARDGTKPLLLWQHNPDEPIGVWDQLVEDGKGLFGKGRLLLGVRRAAEAYELLKAGALKGLSIGYRIITSEPDGSKRKLTSIDLLEASLVSFPANKRARVVAVKSDSEHWAALRDKLAAGDLPSEREFEKGMRDAFDLSNSQAERAVRLFLKREGQGDPDVTTAEQVKARLTAIAKAASASILIRK